MKRGKGRKDTIWPFILVSFLPSVVVAYNIKWFMDEKASEEATWT